MPINKIAVYQGEQWITQNIAVQSSDIIGNIQSSQIESLDSSKITGLNHSASYAALAAVNTNGRLIVPSTPVLHTYLTGLKSNVQGQLDTKASTDDLSSGLTSLQNLHAVQTVNTSGTTAVNSLNGINHYATYIIDLQEGGTQTVEFRIVKNSTVSLYFHTMLRYGSASFKEGSLFIRKGSATSSTISVDFEWFADISDKITITKPTNAATGHTNYDNINIPITYSGSVNAQIFLEPISLDGIYLPNTGLPYIIGTTQTFS